MQSVIRLHILSALCFLLFSSAVQAQTFPGIDTDIHELRNTSIPTFRYTYDDYLQYLPAMVMIGMKIGGYEGLSSWNKMLAADALSCGIMAAAVNSIKYTVRRPRPDGSANNSFPSGHTATAFMTATMLYKEYGWKSPWISIGSYSIAAVTGVSRILNNKHWMSDVAMGAAIGIGSVHLGYYLTDLIFNKKHINPAYEPQGFSYTPSEKYYAVEFYFARRFIFGNGSDYFTGAVVTRGGSSGVSADIPVRPGTGVSMRLGANSLTYTTGESAYFHDALAGGYYNIHFAKRFEFQTKAMVGLAFMPESAYLSLAGHRPVNSLGAAANAGISLSFMLDDNFKIKAFAGYDAIGSIKGKWLHSTLVGWSAACVW